MSSPFDSSKTQEVAHKIVWKPSQIVEIPELIKEYPSFPAIPSAYYPGKLNYVGTPEQIAQSAKIWYSLLEDELFPLDTVYAQARPDQLGYDYPIRPPSELAYSMKKRWRQYPDLNNWLQLSSLNFLADQIPHLTTTDILFDIYRFPLDPVVNFFECLDLVHDYIDSLDINPIKQYFRNKNWNNLVQNLESYPPYELLFLMTRGYSRPLNSLQLELIMIRIEGGIGSPVSKFIDNVFYYPDSTKYSDIRTLAEKLLVEPAQEVGILVGTPYADWVNWAPEYLDLLNSDILEVVYSGAGLGYLEDQYATWPDSYLIQLSRELNFELPERSEYPNRRAWIGTIASLAQRRTIQ